MKKKYYCKVCKKDHVGDGMSIDYCDGCGMEHPHNRWKTTWNKGEKYTLCGNLYKSYTPIEKRWDNYSPEEVMSGVPFGGDLKKSPFKKESQKNWSQESAEQVAFAKEVLS